MERDKHPMLSIGAIFSVFLGFKNNRIPKPLNIKLIFLQTAFGTVSAPQWGT